MKSNGAKERGIIECYLQRENRYHTAQSSLVKCVTVWEDGKGKYAPAFNDGVLEHIDEFRAAETAVATVRADISEILGELGEFQSVGEMGDTLRRSRLAIESSERNLRVAISKASITEGEKAMESKAVIEASLRRDQVRDEQQGLISNLESRLGKINQILERY